MLSPPQRNRMVRRLTWLRRVAVSGTVASITSALALAMAAKAEGHGALQPLNATSHWLHGPGAAKRTQADLAHTGLGYATHHAATIFWAAAFELWAERRSGMGPAVIVRDATMAAVVAAAVDYLATPKRFTPGWEFVLSEQAMALAYLALGAGLAVGAAAQKRIDPE